MPDAERTFLNLARVERRPKSNSFSTRAVNHLPALMAVGECYLALPNPDANFVTDFQTNNFASRLFELFTLAGVFP